MKVLNKANREAFEFLKPEKKNLLTRALATKSSCIRDVISFMYIKFAFFAAISRRLF